MGHMLPLRAQLTTSSTLATTYSAPPVGDGARCARWRVRDRCQAPAEFISPAPLFPRTRSESRLSAAHAGGGQHGCTSSTPLGADADTTFQDQAAGAMATPQRGCHAAPDTCHVRPAPLHGLTFSGRGGVDAAAALAGEAGDGSRDLGRGRGENGGYGRRGGAARDQCACERRRRRQAGACARWRCGMTSSATARSSRRGAWRGTESRPTT